MTNPKSDASDQPDYADFLIAIALYESTGKTSVLYESIGACIEIGPGEVGRPITREVCTMIGAAFVQRSLCGAGTPEEPWRKSALLTHAIAKAYAEALKMAQARRGREKVPRAKSLNQRPRTNPQWAADHVRSSEPFKRLRLTRSSVQRAVTAARKNPH